MRLDDIKTIGVVGAGQMGCGIAQVLAQGGWTVFLTDVSETALQKAMAGIMQGLRHAAEKGGLGNTPVENIANNIHLKSDVEPLRDAQLIIEAISEDTNLKYALFDKLGRLCPTETILASNTSSISIDELGAVSHRPDRVVGIHFMNPAPVMKLVEVVRGKETAEQTVALALALVDQLGKTAVECKDSPGFIVNRLLMPMINEAIFALEEGVATPESIDQGVRDGLNHPVGPLALADRIGLDTVLAICEVLSENLDQSKFRPCPLLRRYVEAGWLGRKSGQGFYTYATQDERRRSLTNQS